MPIRKDWPPAPPLVQVPLSVNILASLQRRELGAISSLTLKQFGAPIKSRIDSSFSLLSKTIDDLATAIENKDWTEIERSVSQLLTRLIDATGMESSYDISPTRRSERETFVALGGMRLLLSLLEPPYTDNDARLIQIGTMHRKAEFWNELLVLLREVCYSVPNLADTAFSANHLRFLFTLLSHHVVFENTMNLLEEVLAVKVDTFDLYLVPRLYSLLDGFSSRQMMHFCRVLALVLFESEDRQIMECAHVLRSFDLLQLRRDRMAKFSNIVERNQCLVIEMPNLLEKLVLLLRIVNYGPELSKLVRNNIIAQTPSDIFQYIPNSRQANGRSEWDLFRYLNSIVLQSGPGLALGAQDLDVTDRLLTAFSPATEFNNMMANILSIMEVAESLGIATFSANDLTPLGIPALVQRSRSSYTHREAMNHLQFQSMLLVPHQVELLFVLCTLLSGRRKIDVQKKLADLGLVQSMQDMFTRLSWGAEPFLGANPMEHIHGPNCECNPESAIRVQYLRLVHNFYDRDFVDNPNKDLLLSPSEIIMIRDFPERLFSGKAVIPISERGLLSRITSTLMNEPSESIYRFWLSSSLEAFLRGSNKDHQAFVAHTGVIQHMITHVLTVGVKSSSNLQTAFDLLGELTKFNKHTLEILESCFDEQMFSDFMEIVMSNLVDSNVFLRSLYLSFEYISNYPDEVEALASDEASEASYLTHSWVQFVPDIVSQRAVDRILGSDQTSSESSSKAASPTSPGRHKTGHLASIGRGVMNVFRGLHSAAVQFVQRGHGKRSMGPITATATVTSPESPAERAMLTPPPSPSRGGTYSGRSPISSIRSLSSGSPSSRWVVPDSLFRLSLFLAKERENILLKLMNTVSIHTVNHENICCLNTSLLLFVLAFGRGNMASLLSSTRLSAFEVKGSSSPAKGEVIESEDPVIFRNFRELLWYWREYYLRRGRDRLSLEFSSHIPFRQWEEVVDLLCRDDGSPTALLGAGIKLPKSPYRHMPRPTSSTSEFIQNHTRPMFIQNILYDSVD